MSCHANYRGLRTGKRSNAQQRGGRAIGGARPAQAQSTTYRVQLEPLTCSAAVEGPEERRQGETMSTWTSEDRGPSEDA